MQHSEAIKGVAGNVPVGWPHDGNAREKGTGETLAAIYKRHGLLMTPSHMTWPDGGVSFEAGIAEMQERLGSGRLKVAAHLNDWFEEYRLYHRDAGLVVKVKDDLMSATRLGVMGKRFGRPGLLVGGTFHQRRRQTQADGVDFDLFGG